MSLHRLVRSAAWPPLLLAALASCYDRADYVLTPAIANERFQLFVADSISGTPVSGIPADGFSEVTIAARVDSRADARYRTVVFTKFGGGTFVGGSGSDAREVIANDSGYVSVRLKSDKILQTVRVRAIIKDAPAISRDVEINFVAVVPDSIIRFIEVPAALEADGASSGTVRVQVAPQLLGQPVTFTATLLPGGVTTSQASPDASGRALLDLKAGLDSGMARVQAAIAGFGIDTVVKMVRALPDSVSVDISLGKANATQDVTVTAHLLRARGIATKNARVRFEAIDSLGVMVGQFRNVQPSNDQGQSTSVYTAVGVTQQQTIRIRAIDITTGRAGEAKLRFEP